MPVYREKNKNKWTKDGRSYYYKCQYKDVYGQTKTKKSKLFKSSSEAKEAERKFLEQSSYEKELNANISFEYVYNEWLEYKKQKIKITTYYDYVKNLNKNILNFFKNYKLNNISFKILNDWKVNLANKNLSLQYQNAMIGYLQEILNYASEYYNFDKKIANKLQKNRIDNKNEKVTDAEINFWTYEEFNKFIKVVNDDFYYLLFNFLYFTGLRIGELRALKWKNIDLINKKVTIKHSLCDKILEDKFVILDPKTNNSNRIVDLDDKLMSLIYEHKKREEKLYGFNDEFFIFGNVRYLPLTTTRRMLDKYIKIAKIKRITIHGFRHSHVSLLIYLGCDVRDVADRIGDTVDMVEKTYYHMFPEKKQKTVNKLNNL